MRAAAIFAVAACAAAAAAVAGRAQDDPLAGLPVLAARLADPAIAFHAAVDGLPEPEMVALGRLVAMGGAEVDGAAYACFRCHGPEGGGDPAAAVPRLAGLPGAHLYTELQRYAAGVRENAVMSPIARAMSEEERVAASVYYALLPPASARAQVEHDPALLQHGGQLSAIGSVERAIPACANCHGPYGTGMAPSVPPLAGQHGAFIVARLEEWREDQEPWGAVNPMVPIAVKMTDRDIAAVAAYFETLSVPEEAPGG